MIGRCAVLLILAVLSGCAPDNRPADPASPPRSEQPDLRPVIVAFGDSLTAGAGLDPGLSYPDYLQKELDRKGYKYRVVNQGISGDTTSGGVTRMDVAASLRPRVVILELGANDGLRGLPVAKTRENLAEMIDTFERNGAKVLLCGMTLPRNYGSEYIRSFEDVFRGLSRDKKVTLIPFLLEGVATRRDLMQPDGLHPTAEGNAKVAQTVIEYLTPLLKE